MDKKTKRFLISISIFIFGFLVVYGYLDIPQKGEGVVIHKERKYNGDFGIFTIELTNKKYPKEVIFDRVSFSSMEVGDRIIIDYKIPLLPWKKSYGLNYERLE